MCLKCGRKRKVIQCKHKVKVNDIISLPSSAFFRDLIISLQREMTTPDRPPGNRPPLFQLLKGACIPWPWLSLHPGPHLWVTVSLFPCEDPCVTLSPPG